jgi:hypothetical protein
MCGLCDGAPGMTRRAVLRGALGAAVAGVALSATSTPLAAQPVTLPYGLRIQRRSAWAGDGHPPGPLGPEDDVRFLLVHHTAGTNSYRPEDVPRLIRDVYDFHTGRTKRWPDVVYNFMVDRYGGVWEARAGSLDGPVINDATGGSQGFAQLVCLLGDFTSVMPTPEAIDSTVRLLAWMADRHRVDTAEGAEVEFVSRGSNLHSAGAIVRTATIVGHRMMSSTACPGDTFFPFVRDELQAAVHALRATAAPAPTTSPSTTSPSTTPPSTAQVATVAPSTSTSSSTTTPAAASAATDPDVSIASPRPGGDDVAIGSIAAASAPAENGPAERALVGGGAAATAAALTGALVAARSVIH